MSEKLRAGQRAPAGRMGQPVGETHIEDSPPAPGPGGWRSNLVCIPLAVWLLWLLMAAGADAGMAFRREERSRCGPVGDPGDL